MPTLTKPFNKSDWREKLIDIIDKNIDAVDDLKTKQAIMRIRAQIEIQLREG